MLLPGEIYTAGKYINYNTVGRTGTSEVLCNKLELKNKRKDERLPFPPHLQVKSGSGRSDPSDKTRESGGGEAYSYKLHITLSFSR